MRKIISLIFFVALSAFAQSSQQKLHLVLPNTPGSITVGLFDGWQVKSFRLYIDGMHGNSPIYRPVLLLDNKETKIETSYILFANDTKSPTAEGCRDADRGSFDVVKKFAKNHGELISEIKESAYKTPSGRLIPVSSYFVDSKQPDSLPIMDMHAYIGDTGNCATLHLTKEQYQTTDEKQLDLLVDRFTEEYEKDYAPTVSDYMTLANLLIEYKSPSLATIYANRAVAIGGNGLTSDIPRINVNPLVFAFAVHPGNLKLDLPTYAITELSAKPKGGEFGIRAKDKKTGVDMLGFLYLPPEKAPITSASCMQNQLQSELKGIQDQANYRNISAKRVIKNQTGLEMGVVEYEPTGKIPRRFGFTARFFVAAMDICADISFDSDSSIAPSVIDTISNAITFDENHVPDFFDKFRYATVLYEHGNVADAAPIFESALSMVSTVDDSTKWRRMATDLASMSYGISGDLKRSRAINERAIEQDPNYPLYYYNIACADAEAGDSNSARKHLQQAYDRRNNALKGETLPDPTQDNSILKLKNDKDFWNFVVSLPTN
ncbi:MAG: tetratricopeptide repeat protein [Terracidiphilus sp.]